MTHYPKFKLLAFCRKQTPFIDRKCTYEKVTKNWAGSPPPPLIWKKSKRKATFFVKLSLTRASIILCLTSWTILMIGRMVLLRAYKRGHFLSRRERPPQEDLCLLIFIRERNCFNLMLSFVVKKERLYQFKNTLSLFQKDHYAAFYQDFIPKTNEKIIAFPLSTPPLAQGLETILKIFRKSVLRGNVLFLYVATNCLQIFVPAEASIPKQQSHVRNLPLLDTRTQSCVKKGLNLQACYKSYENLSLIYI